MLYWISVFNRQFVRLSFCQLYKKRNSNYWNPIFAILKVKNIDCRKILISNPIITSNKCTFTCIWLVQWWQCTWTQFTTKRRIPHVIWCELGTEVAVVLQIDVDLYHVRNSLVWMTLLQRRLFFQAINVAEIAWTFSESGCYRSNGKSSFN